VLDTDEMNHRNDPDNTQAQSERGNAGQHTFEIDAECHGGECSWGSEPDCRRYPTGQETEGWVIDAGQKVILASRARQCCCQLGVGEGAAQRR
jgi:hypothetical protein